MDINDLRNKYKRFIYHSYKIIENESKVILEYEFEIENLIKFHPKIEILKKQFVFKDLNSQIAKNIVFNIGMVEAISYFKATCSPEFLIKCGKLDDKQKEWFKKLYYLGLGEFRYINNIDISKENFVEFISYGEEIRIDKSLEVLDGIIIPIGGGKDSNVTLDLLEKYKDESLAFCIGSKNISLECAKIAGFDNKDIIEIKRIIDRNLLELNSQGFFNGHTPFSAIVAFITYFMAFLLKKKYIALSNEQSANESNVYGENINHQYSKTIEFENDFREYSKKYLFTNIEYFSILRPINELQIAMLFSKLEKYHQVFKSCNVGSKQEPWKWCCNCPKCLFVYTILSPFLYKEKLVNIFGEDLFERKDLLQTFIELCGYGEVKPFECVGTFSEIQYAITKTIEKQKQNLPFLLQYYKDNFKLSKEYLLDEYYTEHNVPKQFEEILKERISFVKNSDK